VQLVPFVGSDGRQILAHTLLFVPIGAWTLEIRRTRASWKDGAILAAAFAAALAFGQVFVLSRHTDMTDVLLEVIGGALGAILASLARGADAPDSQPVRLERKIRHAPVSGHGKAWYAAITLLTVLFVIYISLLPFHFVQLPPGASLLHVLRPDFRHLRVRGGMNFVANAWMFVPIGLCGLASLVDSRHRWWRWGLAVCVVLAGSIALSVGVETAQAFVPGRTPSVMDVTAQTLGCAAGLAAWMLFSRPLDTFVTSVMAGERRAYQTALGVYLVFQIVSLLEPFRVVGSLSEIARRWSAGDIVLVPWHHVFDSDVITAMIADAIFALPVGAWCLIAGRPAGARRSIGVAAALGAGFYLIAEIVQIVIRTRHADALEFIANASGAVAGVYLAAIATAPSDEIESGRVARWCGIGLVVAAAIYAAYNFTPFEFSWSLDMLRARGHRLLDVPFYAYYVNPEFKALREITVKLGLGIPLGLLFRLRERTRWSAPRPFAEGLWLLTMAVFFTACELGQVFLPARFPDNTDVLLATTGVWIGMQLVRPLGWAAERNDRG
jgi:glycopeptide antibiotics resistance protein